MDAGDDVVCYAAEGSTLIDVLQGLIYRKLEELEAAAIITVRRRPHSNLTIDKSYQKLGFLSKARVAISLP